MVKVQKNSVLKFVRGQGGVPRWKANCTFCHREEVVPGHEATDGSAKTKLIAKGWKVPPTRKIVCPGCVAKIKSINASKNKEKSNMGTLKQTTSTEIGLADRRKINVEVGLCYREDGRGYDAGHTDRSIAELLDVPVAWVAEIRAGNFGDENQNAEVDRLTGRLTHLSAVVETMEAELREKFKFVEGLGRQAEQLHRDIQKAAG